MTSYLFFFFSVKLLFKWVLLSHNSHTIQFIHLKCTIQFFSIFTELCKPSPQSISNIFLTLPAKPIPISSLYRFQTPSSRQPLIYFLSLYICLFWVFHTCSQTLYGLFWLAYTHLAPCFQGLFMLVPVLVVYFPLFPGYILNGGFKKCWQLSSY